MSALLLILGLFGAGLLAWAAQRLGPAWPGRVGLLACLAGLALVETLWLDGPLGQGLWLDELHVPWVPRFGIGLHLAFDGLSLPLVALTLVLGLAAILAAPPPDRPGFFLFCLLATLAGLVGVFTSLDLLLFFVFWEAMLVPMALMIALWGYEERLRAAVKFFLFTQASGLLLLAAILGLVFAAWGGNGRLSFDYLDLRAAGMEPPWWVLAGFFIAFAVKLPVLPLHTWLPDAHTQAPTAGSVILAGVMLKAGAYGMLRFLWPLMPEATAAFAPVAMGLGLAGILYGAVLAFAQTDIKRLVAYTSVSHMGFVLIGVFAHNPVAQAGAVVQMLAHGLSTGALFLLVGALQARLHTRDLRQLGGLWPALPRFGALLLLFAVASLGLPGLGNFMGEFLVLLGAWRRAPWLAAGMALGLVLAAIYALALVQRILHGEGPLRRIVDLDNREAAVGGALALLLLVLGLWPQPLLDALAGEGT